MVYTRSFLSGQSKITCWCYTQQPGSVKFSVKRAVPQLSVFYLLVS